MKNKKISLKEALPPVPGKAGRPVTVPAMALKNLLDLIKQSGPLGPEQAELEKQVDLQLKGQSSVGGGKPMEMPANQTPVTKAKSLVTGKPFDIVGKFGEARENIKFGPVRDPEDCADDAEEGPWHTGELENKLDIRKALGIKEFFVFPANKKRPSLKEIALTEEEDREQPMSWEDTKQAVDDDNLYMSHRKAEVDKQLSGHFESVDRQNKIYDDEETSLDISEEFDKDLKIYDKDQENLQERELDQMTPEEDYAEDLPDGASLKREGYWNRSREENDKFDEWMSFLRGESKKKKLTDAKNCLTEARVEGLVVSHPSSSVDVYIATAGGDTGKILDPDVAKDIQNTQGYSGEEQSRFAVYSRDIPPSEAEMQVVNKVFQALLSMGLLAQGPEGWKVKKVKSQRQGEPDPGIFIGELNRKMSIVDLGKALKNKNFEVMNDAEWSQQAKQAAAKGQTMPKYSSSLQNKKKGEVEDLLANPKFLKSMVDIEKEEGDNSEEDDGDYTDVAKSMVKRTLH